MKKKYFKITLLILILIAIVSCSKEETETSKQMAARPTVLINSGDVRIGTQIWMIKNLNVSRYRNGDPIPQVTDETQWANLMSGAWCYYNNESSKGIIYGKLYNWYAINDPRGLCPTGYHIPTDAEWTVLTTFLGGEVVAGGKMKALTSWFSPNNEATNSSGFTGLAGGCRNDMGIFSGIYNNGTWWSSSEYVPSYAYSRSLSFYYGNAYQYIYGKTNGFSVRCLKD